MACSLLIPGPEALGEELAMKPGWRRWARASLLLVVVSFFVACGGSSSGSSTNLNSGNTGSSGTGITNTVSSPSEMSVGDIMAIDLSESSEATIDFSGASSGANFIFAVGASNSTGDSSSVQLSADLGILEGSSLIKDVEVQREADDGYHAQEILHAWLRASEDVLPDTEVPIGQGKGLLFAKSMNSKAVSIGSTETFRVLASLSSTTSYVEVTGQVHCIGNNVIFYVDTSVSETDLSDQNVQTLCDEFDSVAGAEQNLIGEISDFDSNGKLKVLMTKQVNRLGAMGGGIITGYFYAGDLYERSASNVVSNYGEIIYTMVPDPSGTYGTAVSAEFAMSNLLPAVLPHELQHAISYNQHVFVNGGSPEENWLNEGMSHLIEDVMGYGVENPSRYGMYIASPSTYGIVTQSSPNLMERGAAYLFLRFLYEQSENGDAFLASLVDTARRGVSNLEAAFGGPDSFNEFSEFMGRWVVALTMTDRGISQDSRYIYEARTRHATTGNWQGVCLECDADDNRGTTLTGIHLNQYYGSHNPTIDGSTAIFYDITTLPGQIRLTGTQGGGNFGILVRTR